MLWGFGAEDFTQSFARHGDSPDWRPWPDAAPLWGEADRTAICIAGVETRMALCALGAFLGFVQ